MYVRGGSRISEKGYKGVGVRFADFIYFFLKGTATLITATLYVYQEKLYEP